MRFKSCFFIFGIFLILMSNFMQAIDKDTLKILETYKKEGLTKTEKLLNDYFKSKDYWLSFLKDKDTTYGYYENIEYLFISDKSRPNLSLFKVEQNKFSLVMQTDALVGKGRGAKQKEGDLITPIGVYSLMEKLTRLDQYYGPLALTTNYPNSYDKALKKTGYGIWIHGKPLNGDRKDLLTRGCIVVDNDKLIEYERAIDLNKSLLITYEDLLNPVSSDTIATILSNLYEWKSVWEDSKVDQYLSFYSKEFEKIGNMSYQDFINYKKRVFAKGETKSIDIKDINIAPYPNDQNKNMFLISFNQSYKAYKNDRISFTSQGKKELYIILEGEKFHIVSEK